MNKKYLALAAAAVAGYWMWTQRTIAAAHVVTPSAVGATVQQQAADAARNMNLINMLGSWVGTLQPSVVTGASRAITRAGDPYYYGAGAVTGTTAPDNPNAPTYAPPDYVPGPYDDLS